MKKKQLRSLVEESYTKNQLDESKVDVLTSDLKRKDLKQYIRALKLRETKNIVTVAVPTASVYNTTKQIFFDLFPDKTIVMNEDRLLMLGAKVRADDMLYDFTLKGKMDAILDE